MEAVLKLHFVPPFGLTTIYFPYTTCCLPCSHGIIITRASVYLLLLCSGIELVHPWQVVAQASHIPLWALDTVTLRFVLSCSLVRAFCHDDFVGLVYGRNACFQISPRECNFVTPDLTVNEKYERTTRASDQ